METINLWKVADVIEGDIKNHFEDFDLTSWGLRNKKKGYCIATGFTIGHGNWATIDGMNIIGDTLIQKFRSLMDLYLRIANVNWEQTIKAGLMRKFPDCNGEA